MDIEQHHSLGVMRPRRLPDADVQTQLQRAFLLTASVFDDLMSLDEAPKVEVEGPHWDACKQTCCTLAIPNGVQLTAGDEPVGQLTICQWTIEHHDWRVNQRQQSEVADPRPRLGQVLLSQVEVVYAVTLQLDGAVEEISAVGGTVDPEDPQKASKLQVAPDTMLWEDIFTLPDANGVQEVSNAAAFHLAHQGYIALITALGRDIEAIQAKAFEASHRANLWPVPD